MQLNRFAAECGLAGHTEDTHHFLTDRDELGRLFKGKKQYLMERFYRVMRARTGLLMPEKRAARRANRCMTTSRARGSPGPRASGPTPLA